MTKLPEETTETIWSLKRQLLDIVDEATAAIERIQSEVPTMERSVQEVKMEWNLP